MKYELHVVSEHGENFFAAIYSDKRFLFRRIDASTLIANEDSYDQFEITRNGSIIMTGACYHLLEKWPIFWIEYSELSFYSTASNISCPRNIIFADDLRPGDIIHSDVPIEERKGQGYASIMSFMNFIDTSFNNFVRKTQVDGNMKITMKRYGGVYFNYKPDTRTVLGIKTYMVPACF